MTTASPIPRGFRSVTPHMIIKNAAEAMEFYVKAFGAVEISRFEVPGMGLLAHGLLQIGDSFVMVADEFPPDFGCADALSPTTAGGSTLRCTCTPTTWTPCTSRPWEAGCESVFEPMDAFWGRPLRPGAGPLWPPLGSGHPHQGHERAGDRRSRGRGVFGAPGG